MSEPPTDRFEIVVEQGPPHGGLYELEQTTYYRVIDRLLNRVVLVFESEMEANLCTTTGMWDEYRFSGVCEVHLVPDNHSVIVTYCDGREAVIPLPL